MSEIIESILSSLVLMAMLTFPIISTLLLCTIVRLNVDIISGL